MKDKRRRGIDYSTEVPFEHKPQAGFFDVNDENVRTKEVAQEFRPVTIEELEGGKRKKVRLE